MMPSFQFGGESSGVCGDAADHKMGMEDKAAAGGAQHGHTCPICLQEIPDGEEAYVLDCFHVYHLSCLMNWAERKRSCPVCKRRLSEVVVDVFSERFYRVFNIDSGIVQPSDEEWRRLLIYANGWFPLLPPATSTRRLSAFYTSLTTAKPRGGVRAPAAARPSLPQRKFTMQLRKRFSSAITGGSPSGSKPSVRASRAVVAHLHSAGDHEGDEAPTSAAAAAVIKEEKDDRNAQRCAEEESKAADAAEGKMDGATATKGGEVVVLDPICCSEAFMSLLSTSRDRERVERRLQTFLDRELTTLLRNIDVKLVVLLAVQNLMNVTPPRLPPTLANAAANRAKRQKRRRQQHAYKRAPRSRSPVHAAGGHGKRRRRSERGLWETSANFFPHSQRDIPQHVFAQPPHPDHLDTDEDDHSPAPVAAAAAAAGRSAPADRPADERRHDVLVIESDGERAGDGEATAPAPPLRVPRERRRRRHERARVAIDKNMVIDLEEDDNPSAPAAAAAAALGVRVETKEHPSAAPSTPSGPHASSSAAAAAAAAQPSSAAAGVKDEVVVKQEPQDSCPAPSLQPTLAAAPIKEEAAGMEDGGGLLRSNQDVEASTSLQPAGPAAAAAVAAEKKQSPNDEDDDECEIIAVKPASSPPRPPTSWYPWCPHDPVMGCDSCQSLLEVARMLHNYVPNEQRQIKDPFLPHVPSPVSREARAGGDGDGGPGRGSMHSEEEELRGSTAHLLVREGVAYALMTGKMETFDEADIPRFTVGV
ncbi:unnamed protein product [Vitrella brassicaformis CCMP3155]|uniref:RING-type E3 ubiquitin transferase n=2 Tax=Vitrella brassicaformis TaxID=1169539 RepID=A0A0G4G6Z4_VITBC|nr:unnamed protein product [Vitrella brassicaformis CCMP3155]|eukprot:CEM24441.1 unnamed protein product [Vitrella brassicaformis CCMP3155]